MRGPHALQLACLAALVVGCAGTPRVDREALPASPIAILYLDEGAALERQDALSDLEDRDEGSGRPGVARLEFLDGMFGGVDSLRMRAQGHKASLALVDPATGEAEPMRGAPPWARPAGWSPDRSRLLLAGRFRDRFQLFVWERESGYFSILTGGEEHPMGCLGPDGRVVAVRITQDGGRYDARLYATSDAGWEAVSPGPFDVSPACSPDGRTVAYTTGFPDGSTRVAVVDLESAEPPRIVARGSDPVFTPDGGWIVYAGPSTQGSRIWRVRPDGGGRAGVGGQPSGEEADPAVSPDGRYVVYVYSSLLRRQLWVRRLDGTGDRPLLESGDGSNPVW